MPQWSVSYLILEAIDNYHNVFTVLLSFSFCANDLKLTDEILNFKIPKIPESFRKIPTKSPKFQREIYHAQKTREFCNPRYHGRHRPSTALIN